MKSALKSKVSGRDIQDFELMTNAQLWAKVNESFKASAEYMLVAAKCVGVLKRRGVDVSRINGRMLRTLDKIDDGTLSPDAAYAFLDSPMVLGAIARLPVKQQQRLVSNPVVEVYRDSVTGVGTARVPLNKLNRREVSQVFGVNSVLTITQQAMSLDVAAAPEVQPDEWVQVVLKAAEKKKLRDLAAHDKISLSEVVRRGLRTLGWI